jgi:hypothetical protein
VLHPQPHVFGHCAIKALARIINLTRVKRIHLSLIQARKSLSSNEDSAWQWPRRNA